jgi:hypothetical protein
LGPDEDAITNSNASPLDVASVGAREALTKILELQTRFSPFAN